MPQSNSLCFPVIYPQQLIVDNSLARRTASKILIKQLTLSSSNNRMESIMVSDLTQLIR